MSGSVCAIGGCDGMVLARSWCEKHYRRWYRNGDPETLVRASADDLDAGELREIEALRRGEREWRYR